MKRFIIPPLLEKFSSFKSNEIVSTFHFPLFSHFVNISACVHQFYNDCVNASDHGNCVEIFEKLPEDSKNLIYFLCSFLTILSSYEEVTRMTLDNLAVVFSPGFLRSDADDPLIAMTKADLERKFVGNLIATLQVPKNRQFRNFYTTNEIEEMGIGNWRKFTVDNENRR